MSAANNSTPPDNKKTGFWRNEAVLFFSALSLLTRIPCPDFVGWSPDRLARSARSFPLVGLCIGIDAAILWIVLMQLLPATIAAGLVLIFITLLTGALHEDGLGDCCDGLFGHVSRERALEIMRDSRIGAYACVGIVLSIGLRWMALASLGLWTGAAAIVIAHTASRAMMPVIMTTTPYARPKGLGATDGAPTGSETGVAVLIAAIVSLLAGGQAGLVALLIAGGMTVAWRRYILRKLSGHTGDTLGATQQIAEMTILVTLAGFWSVTP